jgi:hypothetical protein
VRLERRFGNWFNGIVTYTYQNAKSTGSDPLANQERAVALVNQVTGVVGPPPQAILSTTLSRPYNLSGAVSITVPADWKRGTVYGAVLRDAGLYATFQYASGSAYTPCRDSEANASALSDNPIACAEFRGPANSARLPASKQFDLRVTKGFGLGRVALTAYFDARNLFNFTNIVRVFSATGTTVNPLERAARWATDSSLFAEEAQASGAYAEDGAIDLTFDGTAASGCAGWIRADGRPAAPNCVYFIRAEERFGDGDHRFTLSEQRRASETFYQFERGLQTFTDDPRRLRVGIEASF